MKKYLFVWVILFSFSFGASAEEEAVAPQEMLPEYYPKYSPEKGRINEIDFGNKVFKVNGVFFDLADPVKVYFPSTKNGTLNMLREGQSILYDLNPNGRINSIWVLPSELSVPES